MALALVEKEQELTNKLIKFVGENVQDGRLFALFKVQMHYIHQIKDWDNVNEKQEVIDDFIALLRNVCLNSVRCCNCLKSYKFRNCRNPATDGSSTEVHHAIELSCSECGDYYTIAENRTKVSYFNFKVISKIYNLNRWGRGLRIEYTFEELVSPCVLTVYHSGEKPLIKIDANTIRCADDVQDFWNQSKALLKTKRNKLTEHCKTEEARIYIL